MNKFLDDATKLYSAGKNDPFTRSSNFGGCSKVIKRMAADTGRIPLSGS